MLAYETDSRPTQHYNPHAAERPLHSDVKDLLIARHARRYGDGSRDLRGFDAMIRDETSKATITDLLVLDARARKWIPFGHHRQLTHYVDFSELDAVVSERVTCAGIDEPDANWVRELSSCRNNVKD